MTEVGTQIGHIDRPVLLLLSCKLAQTLVSLLMAQPAIHRLAGQ